MLLLDVPPYEASRAAENSNEREGNEPSANSSDQLIAVIIV